MANIQTLLAKILSAIYGEEVRGSIHDAIEAINDEVEAWTELQDGTVTTAKLASNAVTTAKIADGAITRAKLNADVVDTTLAVSGAPADAKTVGDKVSDLKSKISNSPFVGIEFTVLAGKEHSSFKDQLSVNIKAGEKYRVIRSGGGTLYAYRADGTAIGNISESGMASEDISALGVYRNNSTAEDIVVRMVVAYNPVGADIYDYGASIIGLQGDIEELNKNDDVICGFIGTEIIPFQYPKYVFVLNGSSVTMEDGVPVASSYDANYKSGYIECSEGDLITVNGIGGISARLWAFVQSDGTIIEKAGESRTENGVEHIAPANSAFFVVNTKDGRVSNKGKTPVSQIEELQYGEEFDYLVTTGHYTQQTITGYAIKNNVSVGAVVDLTPVSVENMGSIIVRNIAEGMSFLVFGTGTYNYLYWSWLDKDKKLISKANTWASSGASGTIIVAPQNARYLICSSTYNYAYGFSVQYLGATELLKNQIEEISASGVDSVKTEANLLRFASFKFLFFSDVHSASVNVQRIIDFAEDKSVDCIINAGDTVSSYLNDPNDNFDWYEDQLSASSVDILSAVGNHDVWDGAFWTKADSKDVYDTIVAPIVSNFSDIQQPSDAETLGLCYYYKDYGQVRVVVLNAMTGDSSVNFWDSTEANWLTQVLSDAVTNSKHVIVCNHAPFPKNIALRDEKSNWNSFIDYRTNPSYDAVVTHYEALNIIDTFIENGGKFICLLTGHTHLDNVLTATGYDGQYMFNIASAKYGNHRDGITYSSESSPYYDCFNYCAVDTTNGIFKMKRVGWNMDASLKTRETLSYDYINHKILHE